MKVLTFSRQFPKGHPKAGQPTWFIESILNVVMRPEGALRLDHIPEPVRELVNDFTLIVNEQQKSHTIRAGNRWKVGDMASLRVWSGAPRRSKQIEFAQVEVKKVWKVQIKFINGAIGIKIKGVEMKGLAGPRIAKNDGLEWLDFVNWFNIHPKKQLEIFQGQIICWNDNIEY